MLLAGALLGSPKGLLVVDMLAIGRYGAGKWSVVKASPSDSLSKERNFNFTILNGPEATGSLPILALEYQAEAAPGWYVTGELASSKVMWAGAKPKLPQAQRLAATSKTYLDAVQRVLDAKGLKTAKARINQIWSVDLDGDGTKEVLIEAATKPDMTETTMNNAKATDYSMVLIRYVKGSRTITRTLAFHDGHSGTLEGADRLRAIADLDGDGVAEIVTSSNYYEGTSATVWRFKKGVLTQLVTNGSGV